MDAKNNIDPKKSPKILPEGQSWEDVDSMPSMRNGGKNDKMHATIERVILPGKKRASVVYLQGKTKYVRKGGEWETLKKASR